MRSTHSKTMHLSAVIEKLTKMLAQNDIVVTQRGSGAYCKFDKATGKVTSINLPMIPPNPTDDFVKAIHGYLDHEVAHALLTSGKEWSAGADDDRNLAGVGKNFRHAVINVVEDVRIENTIPTRYPGATANLQAVRQFLIDTVWGPAFQKLLPASPLTVPQIQTLLLVPYLRALGGHQACVDWCDSINAAQYFERLLMRIPDLADRLKALKSTAEAARLADDLIRAFDKQEAKKPKKQDEPADDKDEKGGSDDSSEGDGDEGTGGDDDEDGGDQAGEDGDGEDGDGEDGDGEDEGEGAGGDGGDDEDGDGSGGDDGEGGEGSDGEGGGKTKATLNRAMRHLKPEQRRAIFLYNTRKMSIDDIATDLKMTREQAEQTLKDGRRRLSRAMTGK